MPVIRVGTRSSQLARWQADKIISNLEARNTPCEIIEIQSEGDMDTKTPIEQLGTVGVFTKALDEALLDNRIDMAVHSCKDLPTTLPDGLKIAAYLQRGPYNDVLIHHDDPSFLANTAGEGIIATGSIRRRAQWRYKYPNHEFTALRGNIYTRIEKFRSNQWNGMIMAEAAIARLNLSLPYKEILTWMVPAPAQGVIAVVIRSDDHQAATASDPLNDQQTAVCASLERQFLKTLEGGCSAPIGALAIPRGDKLKFKGVLLDPSGKQKLEVSESLSFNESASTGDRLAQQILEKGGEPIIKTIKQNLERQH